MFKKDSVANFVKADAGLKRTLTAKDLIALGVGAVIGTGIFILPGHEAATHAGPAVSIAFLLAAMLAGAVGMAYAEFSSAMPVAGSAYSFGSVVYGEVIGWLLGWGLILEYFLVVSVEGTGFAAYLNNNLLAPIGINIPKMLQAGPLEGGVVNITAVAIVLIVGALILIGTSGSQKVENIAVYVKILIIILFIVVGIFFIKTKNYVPFYPKQFHTSPIGLGGISTATATVFFAFMGFDALSSNSAETINPQKNMAKGIIGTLLIAAILYVSFSLVLTGMVPYTKLNVDDPASFAFSLVHLGVMNKIITIGALFGIFTAMFTMALGSSRLVYSLGRDGLISKKLGKINKKKGVPTRAVVLAIIVQAFFAGLVPLDQLIGVINAGTLIAFIFISFGIIPLRHRKDIVNNGFKMPLYPFLPIIAGLFSLYFLIMLPNEAKITVAIWMLIGFVIYLFYGLKHSRLQNQK